MLFTSYVTVTHWIRIIIFNRYKDKLTFTCVSIWFCRVHTYLVFETHLVLTLWLCFGAAIGLFRAFICFSVTWWQYTSDYLGCLWSWQVMAMTEVIAHVFFIEAHTGSVIKRSELLLQLAFLWAQIQDKKKKRRRKRQENSPKINEPEQSGKGGKAKN